MANQYTFSVQQVQVAPNNGNGTFGSAYELQSTKTVTTAQKLVSDRSQGNTKITALVAQTISYDLSLDTAGFDFSALSIFMNDPATSSNTGQVWTVPNQLMPYFGLVAQAFPEAGDVLWFWPRCKITGDFSYKLEFGKIIVPQFKCEAIEDENLGFIVRVYERPGGGSITFPPVVS